MRTCRPHFEPGSEEETQYGIKRNQMKGEKSRRRRKNAANGLNE